MSIAASYGLLDGQGRCVEHHRVLRSLERGVAASGIARVAPADIGQDAFEGGSLAAPGQFLVAARRAHLRRRRDEELRPGARADHGADVAPVEHGAAGWRREAALPLDQPGCARRHRRDDGGGLTDLAAAQPLLAKAASSKLKTIALRRRPSSGSSDGPASSMARATIR